MLLIDKPFYDYDFEPVKAAHKRVLLEDTVRNEKETYDILSKFGLGGKKEESLEELQALAMKEMNENNKKD